MAKALGNVNFILEDIVDNLIDIKGFSHREIICLIMNELQKYPENQEIYISGKNPILSINHTLYKKSQNPDMDISKKIHTLIKTYCVSHDLQWGEVLYIVFGYLAIHRPKKGFTINYN